MELRVIATSGGCTGGDCPTAYMTDRGTAVIQGYVITDPAALRQVDLPAGETAVEIPLDVLTKAAGAVT
ncbi:MAG: hypothetical protein ACRDP8_16435 [Actinopolymorphaceae bacterium]